MRRGVFVAAVLLACLSTLTAEVSRPAVRTKSGVRRAKRTQPPKKLEVHAFAADAAGLGVREHIYEEPLELGADSVDVEVHACSLGSADVQHLRGDWGPCVMPLVPGRDAVGVVVKAGSDVKGLVKGQRVAVLLSTGTDSENDVDGADRTAEAMTPGAMAHHVRVPARWAFPVPATLPTAHVAGLLSVGSAIWAQLTGIQRLEKGAKVAVVGGGTAGALAFSIASALGYDVYQLGEAPVPPLAEGASKAERRAHKKRLDATDEQAIRLHGGSFDGILCVTCAPRLDLSGLVPYAKPATSILLAGCAASELVAPPRVMQERRLSVVGAPALSLKERQRLLGFCAQHRIRLAHASSELDAEAAGAALEAIAAEPEERHVLVRAARISSWMRANRTGAVTHAAPQDGLVSTGIASVFGVFNKVAEETKNAAKYAREGVSSAAASLVEQVEEESKKEMEERHGSLSNFAVAAKEDGDDEDDDDEDDEEGDADDDEDEDDDDDEEGDEDDDDDDDDDDEDDDEDDEEDDDDEDDEDEDEDDMEIEDDDDDDDDDADDDDDDDDDED